MTNFEFSSTIIGKVSDLSGGFSGPARGSKLTLEAYGSKLTARSLRFSRFARTVDGYHPSTFSIFDAACKRSKRADNKLNWIINQAQLCYQIVF